VRPPSDHMNSWAAVHLHKRGSTRSRGGQAGRLATRAHGASVVRGMIDPRLARRHSARAWKHMHTINTSAAWLPHVHLCCGHTHMHVHTRAHPPTWLPHVHLCCGHTHMHVHTRAHPPTWLTPTLGEGRQKPWEHCCCCCCCCSTWRGLPGVRTSCRFVHMPPATEGRRAARWHRHP